MPDKDTLKSYFRRGNVPTEEQFFALVDSMSPDVILSLITAKGDMLIGGTDGSPEKLVVGTAGQVLTSTGTTVNWESLAVVTSVNQMTVFTIDGVLAAVSNPLRIYNPSSVSRTISKVFISVDTAPTGSSLIVDIHKSGITIFTTQSNRPTITATNFTGQTTTIEVATWAPDEYLKMDLDQVGSSIAGSNLTVHILWS
jgi:hypothetical protein